MLSVLVSASICNITIVRLWHPWFDEQAPYKQLSVLEPSSQIFNNFFTPFINNMFGAQLQLSYTKPQFPAMSVQLKGMAEGRHFKGPFNQV